MCVCLLTLLLITQWQDIWSGRFQQASKYEFCLLFTEEILQIINSLSLDKDSSYWTKKKKSLIDKICAFNLKSTFTYCSEKSNSAHFWIYFRFKQKHQTTSCMKLKQQGLHSWTNGKWRKEKANSCCRGPLSSQENDMTEDKKKEGVSNVTNGVMQTSDMITGETNGCYWIPQWTNKGRLFRIKLILSSVTFENSI